MRALWSQNRFSQEAADSSIYGGGVRDGRINFFKHDAYGNEKTKIYMATKVERMNAYQCILVKWLYFESVQRTSRQKQKYLLEGR